MTREVARSADRRARSRSSLLRRGVAAVVTLTALVSCARGAQRPADAGAEKGTGAISGVILLDGKPAAGAGATLYGGGQTPGPAATAPADAEGRYRFEGLAAGEYRVVPFAPAFVSEETGYRFEYGRQVIVAEGERVEGLDLRLRRGAAITGRVVTADGRPAVGEAVAFYSVDEGSQSDRHASTDDRGVYRAYGLRPGRYRVSAGRPDDSSYVATGTARMVHPRTFHPDAKDEAEAAIVDLAFGSEATGIDIVLARPMRVFHVTGRAVNAETGEPVAGVTVLYGPLAAGGAGLSGAVGSPGRTNARGEFRLSGLVRGSYAVFTRFDEESVFYGEPARVEVADADVAGVVIGVRRGSTLSGQLAIEGRPPGELRLDRYVVYATMPRSVLPTGELSIGNGQARIAPDGSFEVAGLAPGTYHLMIGPWSLPNKPHLLRVERDGADATGGVEVRGSERVEGVRVVAAFGTGAVRGTARFTGPYAEARRYAAVTLMRAGAAMAPGAVSVDERGNFRASDLVPGEYEASLFMVAVDATGREQRFEGKPVHVQVPDGGTVDLDLELDTGEDREAGDGTP